MIIKRPEIVAAWPARSLEHGAAVALILNMLADLATCIPELNQWCCHPPPFVPLPLTVERMGAAVTSASAENTKFPELGWNLGVWCEPNNQPFGLTIFVGSTHPKLGNRITLALPPGGVIGDEQLEYIFASWIRLWQPDWISLNPVRKSSEDRFQLGETTFISRRLETECKTEIINRFGGELFGDGYLFRFDDANIDCFYKMTEGIGRHDSTKFIN